MRFFKFGQSSHSSWWRALGVLRSRVDCSLEVQFWPKKKHLEFTCLSWSHCSQTSWIRSFFCLGLVIIRQTELWLFLDFVRKKNVFFPPNKRKVLTSRIAVKFGNIQLIILCISNRIKAKQAFLWACRCIATLSQAEGNTNINILHMKFLMLSEENETHSKDSFSLKLKNMKTRKFKVQTEVFFMTVALQTPTEESHTEAKSWWGCWWFGNVLKGGGGGVVESRFKSWLRPLQSTLVQL